MSRAPGEGFDEPLSLQTFQEHTPIPVGPSSMPDPGYSIEHAAREAEVQAAGSGERQAGGEDIAHKKRDACRHVAMDMVNSYLI